MSWTDARIPWPRCRALGTHGGGSGLLVDEELARAVRHESSAAVQHHWGVTEGVVWRWRKALGVGQWGTVGSQLLHRLTSQAGADAVKRHEFTEAERRIKSRNARRLNTARHLKTGYHGSRWTPEQLALLGTVPDDEVARRVNRTPNAVRRKREALGIENAHAKPPGKGPPWTAEEDEIVRSLPPAEVVSRTGRTIQAVYGRRQVLGLPRGRTQ